jgi:hypothetical protein
MAAAVVRAPRRQRPLRAILSSQVVVHGVSPSKSAFRVPRWIPSLHAKLQRGRIDREGWAPAPYGGISEAIAPHDAHKIHRKVARLRKRVEPVHIGNVGAAARAFGAAAGQMYHPRLLGYGRRLG